MMLNDTYVHQGMRKALCNEIRKKGFKDEKVLWAINRVPRHLFLDKVFVKHSYEDKPFPIGEDQTISQPFTVAMQTSLLNIQKNDKVLEIGTGSGYQACVLLELGAKVYSIEYKKLLYEKTKVLLEEMNYFPKLFFGDGSLGLPHFAPFDKILITAAAPSIPDNLLTQIKIGGILLVPVDHGEVQVMTRIIKTSDNEHVIEEHGTYKFVPLLGNKGRK